MAPVKQQTMTLVNEILKNSNLQQPEILIVGPGFDLTSHSLLKGGQNKVNVIEIDEGAILQTHIRLACKTADCHPELPRAGGLRQATKTNVR